MNTLFPQSKPDECRVCTDPTVDGRWSYCSRRCRQIARAVQRMFSWDVVRDAVLERDDHTCQSCGLSNEQLATAREHTRELVHEANPFSRRDQSARWEAEHERLSTQYNLDSAFTSVFHVDHIERLDDGGHPFDERNLQTLCKHCHQNKTADENRTTASEQEAISLDTYLESDDETPDE